MYRALTLAGAAVAFSEVESGWPAVLSTMWNSTYALLSALSEYIHTDTSFVRTKAGTHPSIRLKVTPTPPIASAVFLYICTYIREYLCTLEDISVRIWGKQQFASRRYATRCARADSST